MNALPPKGQMPPAEKAGNAPTHPPGNPPGNPSGNPSGKQIHLTMSFEEDMAAEADFTGAEHPGQAQAPTDRPAGGQARRGRAGTDAAQPDPDGAAGAGSSAGTAGAARPVRGSLPPQFAGIELTLTVEVGGLNIALKDLMSVEPGQLLALDRMTSEPVSVLVNGKPFARGEIVAIGDRYGVRLLEIVPAVEIGG